MIRHTLDKLEKARMPLVRKPRPTKTAEKEPVYTKDEYILHYFAKNVFIQDTKVEYETHIIHQYKKSVEYCHHKTLINVTKVSKSENGRQIMTFNLTTAGIEMILLKNEL